MITIELDESPCGNTITVLFGIDAEVYDLHRVKRALKKITGCQKTKLTDDNEIILLGSHVKKVNEFVSRIGF
jgi:translation initiation factor 1 (eIF-1/SUI1)